MKVKELIANLSECDQEMDIVLEPNVSCADTEFSCMLPWEVVNNCLSNIGIRYDEVQVGKDGEFECAYFGKHFEEPIFTKKVVILSSAQFKYGSDENNI